MKKRMDSPDNFESFILLFGKKSLQPLSLITDELLLKMLSNKTVSSPLCIPSHVGRWNSIGNLKVISVPK